MDGTRQRIRVTAASQAAAGRRIQERCQEYLQGDHSEHGGISPQSTVEIALTDYMDRMESEGTVSTDTLRGYRGLLRNHIAPGIGSMRLVHITTAVLEDFLGKVSEGQRHKTFSLLSGCFSDLVRREILSRNPASAVSSAVKSPGIQVRKDQPRQKKVKALSSVEVQDLRALLRKVAKERPSPMQSMLPDLVDFILGCGTRTSETLGVRWQDIDWGASVVHVRGQTARGGWTPRLKTVDSHRSIHLPPPILSMLKKRRKAQEESRGKDKDSLYVFPSASGGPCEQSSVSGPLRKILDADNKARWTDVSYKTLRATHATAVSVVAGALGASQQLGHSEIETVQKYYLARPEVGPDVAAAVQAFFEQ